MRVIPMIESVHDSDLYIRHNARTEAEELQAEESSKPTE